MSFSILSSLASRQSFADIVAKERCLGQLVKMLVMPGPQEVSARDDLDSVETIHNERTTKGWTVLAALSASPSISSQILSSFVWMELLGVLVGYKSFTKLIGARLGAAQTFSRLLWDPITGSICGM